MEVLDIRGVQLCCLEIAKEFAKICERHNIPYYMLGGTMLGAIRHKGFIPWDDDMDFGVPYEYYDDLISFLKAELPKPYRCSTYKDSHCVFFPFFKIEDTSTLLDDFSLPVKKEEKIGINIDIFPLFKCTKTVDCFDSINQLALILGGIFTNSRTHKLRNVFKSFIRFVWLVRKNYYPNKMFKILNSIEPGPYLGNICGRWGQKEIIPVEWYGTNIKFQFEETEFAGIMEYDKYLKQLYGDYMQLPPENQRFVHSANAYKK